MKKFIPYTIPFTIPFMTLLGIHLGGWWVMSGFIICFVIHPILDLLSGKSDVVASENGEYGSLYSFLLWIYVPLQFIFLTAILFFVSNRLYSNLELFGIIVSTGAITGGLGITIAHELVHRRARWERGFGVALLSMVNYAHFRVEHVFGHHKHVATPHDPASARAGESIYTFIVRSLVMSLVSAWKIEAKRKSLLKNRIVHYIAVSIILSSVVHFVLGPTSLTVFMGQSFIAILTLEAINYIEHFGLSREEIRPGVYAPVTELHSWDSTHRLTNWFLFNLGRHAHHHASPNVPYHELRASKTDNALKYGYSTEILLAFIGMNSRKS